MATFFLTNCFPLGLGLETTAETENTHSERSLLFTVKVPNYASERPTTVSMAAASSDNGGPRIFSHLLPAICRTIGSGLKIPEINLDYLE